MTRSPITDAPKEGARAFSMVEVALAASILILGLAGLASAIPNVSHVEEHQRHLAEAATVAGNVIEEAIQQHDKRTLSAGQVVNTYDAKGRVSGGAPYTCLRIVVDGDPVPAGRRIDVIVTWTERNTPKSYSLRTYAYTPII